MKCTSCGADVPQGNQFCIHCGAPVENSQPVENNYTPAQPNNTYSQQPNPNQYGYQGGKMPITIGGWIGRLLIPLIPCVGGIVFIIMLFVWSGDQTKEETFRNWAKAQLILMAIGLGIALVVVLILFATGFFAAMTSTTSHSRYYY